jgi:hypothetical protein
MENINMASPPSTESRRPLQFRLRTAFVAAALLCIPLAVVSLKMRQDRDRSLAMNELQSLGFRTTITATPAYGHVATFVCAKSDLADGDLARVGKYLEVLTRRHDLGLSRGLMVRSVDLSGSRVTESGVAQLQRHFPEAEIRR